MLVLTRKIDEGIVIGENVRVTVLSIQGSEVKIGIDAPKQVRILRSELLAEVGHTNADASKATRSDAAAAAKRLAMLSKERPLPLALRTRKRPSRS